MEFVTVNDYLWLLKELAEIVKPLGKRAMFYLAAAVSDFFLPQDRVVSPPPPRCVCRVYADPRVAEAEHKIQSTKGNLTLEMDQVPKVLRPLVQEWIPEAFIVSFKVRPLPHARTHARTLRRLIPLHTQLETEQALLVPKARKALQRYGHQVVVGNDLHKRKHEVVLVEHDAEGAGQGFKETWLKLVDLQDARRREGAGKDAVEGVEIEEMIVRQLVRRHDAWLSRSA